MKQASISLTIFLAVIFIAALFGASYAKTGTRHVSPIENIRGIDFPLNNGGYVISENLSHADIKLREPVLGKSLILDIAYDPGDVNSLSVGIRENSFWLSYTPITFYTKDSNVDGISSTRTTTVEIPLTDKLQDKDRSVDLMFFTNAENGINPQADPTQDSIEWSLYSIDAAVTHSSFTFKEFKDYVKSVIYKERPL